MDASTINIREIAIGHALFPRFRKPVGQILEVFLGGLSDQILDPLSYVDPMKNQLVE
jgi:hypothetical protein